MTPLERLKELNEKATPGPWLSQEHEGIDDGCRCMSCWHLDGGDVDSLHGNDPLTRKCKHCSEMILSKEDADVIAATRNLLPELLALWEAVNKQQSAPDGRNCHSTTLCKAFDALEKKAASMDA